MAQKIILDDETVDEIVNAWMEENQEVFADIEEWEDQPPVELEAIATDAAMAVMDELKGSDFDVSDQVDQLGNAFLLGLAYMTAASDEAYEAWLETVADDDEEEEDDDEIMDDEGDEPQ